MYKKKRSRASLIKGGECGIWVLRCAALDFRYRNQRRINALSCLGMSPLQYFWENTVPYIPVSKSNGFTARSGNDVTSARIVLDDDLAVEVPALNADLYICIRA